MPHHDSIERINEGEWRWELDPDQSLFHFSCSACGSCCTGDMTICLNLADLQRMAAFVGVDRVGQLFELGYVDELTLEKGGFRPVIRFKTKPFKFCPFLEKPTRRRWQSFGAVSASSRLEATGLQTRSYWT